MRPAGGATEIDDAAYLDLTPHPWAGLPVVVRLEAVDGIDQAGQSEPQEMVLPARPFQHPVARAIIEQRRHLAAEPEQREEVIAALDRLSRAPALFGNDTAVYMALRSAMRRLLDGRGRAGGRGRHGAAVGHRAAPRGRQRCRSPSASCASCRRRSRTRWPRAPATRSSSA